MTFEKSIVKLNNLYVKLFYFIYNIESLEMQSIERDDKRQENELDSLMWRPTQLLHLTIRTEKDWRGMRHAHLSVSGICCDLAQTRL